MGCPNGPAALARRFSPRPEANCIRSHPAMLCGLELPTLRKPSLVRCAFTSSKASSKACQCSWSQSSSMRLVHHWASSHSASSRGPWRAKCDATIWQAQLRIRLVTAEMVRPPQSRRAGAWRRSAPHAGPGGGRSRCTFENAHCQAHLGFVSCAHRAEAFRPCSLLHSPQL